VQVVQTAEVSLSDNHLDRQRHMTINKVCECRITAYAQLQLALGSNGSSALLGSIDGEAPSPRITIGWMFILVTLSSKCVVDLTCK
jgi:hypothetical protein